MCCAALKTQSLKNAVDEKPSRSKTQSFKNPVAQKPSRSNTQLLKNPVARNEVQKKLRRTRCAGAALSAALESKRQQQAVVKQEFVRVDDADPWHMAFNHTLHSSLLGSCGVTPFRISEATASTMAQYLHENWDMESGTLRLPNADPIVGYDSYDTTEILHNPLVQRRTTLVIRKTELSKAKRGFPGFLQGMKVNIPFEKCTHACHALVHEHA